MTVSSPEVIWAYAEAMDLEDRREIIQPLGVSRTDSFFDQSFLSNARKVVGRKVPETAGKRYCCTLRRFAAK